MRYGMGRSNAGAGAGALDRGTGFRKDTLLVWVHDKRDGMVRI